jgi:hypothetical protein
MSGCVPLQAVANTEPFYRAALRSRLIQRFPIVPVGRVDEVIAAHSADEDACIAHLLSAAYNEGGMGEDGKVCDVDPA